MTLLMLIMYNIILFSRLGNKDEDGETSEVQYKAISPTKDPEEKSNDWGF